MTKTDSQKKVAATPRQADLTPPDSAPESLDKVRDILFGGQMRAVETRLQNLEERLLREQDAMRSDFGKQLASVEADAKRELRSLVEQLTAERAKRAEELKALGADLKDALRNLEKRHTKLEEMAGAADAELRDSILEQSRAVAAEIERLSHRVATDLNREVQGLRQDKVDVASLVGIFSDMAGRLGGAPGGDARAAGRDGAGS
jgi:DNA anti-recombination protein RmuC